jgi:transcriptional regulator with XRE-family HTH domain
LDQSTETLGTRLRKLRTAKKLSQQAVAKLAAVGKGYLSELENDNVAPGSPNLSKLADFYGVTTDYLLSGKKISTENVSEPKPVFTCIVKFELPDPSNQLVEDLNLIRDVLESNDPQPKGWLEGQIKWNAWKLRNW